MNHNSFGKNLELNTFRVFYSDGIMDLSFGSMLLIFATNTFMEFLDIEISYIQRMLIIPVVVFFVLIKTFITSKRLGYVKFRPERNKKRLAAMLVVACVLILTAILFLLVSEGIISPEEKNSFFPLLIEFGILVLIFSVLAFFTDYYNFYIVGLAMGIGSPLSILLESFTGTRIHTLAIMFLSGLGLITFGLIQFIGFMRKYPNRPKNEA